MSFFEFLGSQSELSGSQSGLSPSGSFVVVGNPPYGEQATAFVNHALTFATFAVMLVGQTQRKRSYVNKTAGKLLA